jgi:hypothetical protein
MKNLKQTTVLIAAAVVVLLGVAQLSAHAGPKLPEYCISYCNDPYEHTPCRTDDYCYDDWCGWGRISCYDYTTYCRQLTICGS